MEVLKVDIEDDGLKIKHSVKPMQSMTVSHSREKTTIHVFAFIYSLA